MTGIPPSIDAGVLRFDDVHKAFAGYLVLKGFSVVVPLDGLTFVVGRSGSGKSVLCKLASGLLKPDSGSVYLMGDRVDWLGRTALHRLRRDVPYVVQGPALLDWLSVEQNVRLAREDATDDEVAAVLDAADVRSVRDRLPAALSPGVQKRVAIARALLLRPRYLLLDEPTTGLDDRAADAVNQILISLRDRGTGALVVSHDARALRASATRVLVVADGRAAFIGSRDDYLRSEHAHG